MKNHKKLRATDPKMIPHLGHHGGQYRHYGLHYCLNCHRKIEKGDWCDDKSHLHYRMEAYVEGLPKTASRRTVKLWEDRFCTRKRLVE